MWSKNDTCPCHPRFSLPSLISVKILRPTEFIYHHITTMQISVINFCLYFMRFSTNILRWGAGGTSSEPCSDVFCGYRPFSESESLALGKYVYHMRRNIVAFLDVHTFGQMWMSPWGFSRQYPRAYKQQEVNKASPTYVR